MSNKKETKIIANPQSTKERSIRNRIIFFWILSMFIFIGFLTIHLTVVRIDSGRIKFEDGEFQSEKINFRAPRNTLIVVNTGGSYTLLNEIILDAGFLNNVELDRHGSFYFNTSDKDIFTIYVSGRSGTFRFSVYYDNNYYPISKFFVYSAGLCAVILTISLLISKWKLNHAEE